VSLLGLPVKFSETPGDVHRIPPELGEHTDEILREIGLDDEDLRRLREQKVV
jgi:crotonobetainyl-CoA:carnitine CoA-transferase CaiB-like acyl-CoA transferase